MKKGAGCKKRQNITCTEPTTRYDVADNKYDTLLHNILNQHRGSVILQYYGILILMIICFSEENNHNSFTDLKTTQVHILIDHSKLKNRAHQ